MPFLPFLRVVGRTTIFILAFVLVVLLLTLTVFRFQPGLFVLAVNKFTGFEVTTKELETQLWPLSLSFDEFELRSSEVNDLVLVKADKLRTDLDMSSWLSDDQGYGYVELANAQISLPSLDRVFQSELSEQSKESQKAPERIDVHKLLGLININLTNTRLIVDEYTHVDFKALNADANTNSAESTGNTPHRVAVELEYENLESKLSLLADIESRQVNGHPGLEIRIENLDLSSLFAKDKISKDQQEGNADTQSTNKEVDLSWIDGIQDTHIAVNIANIQIQENRVGDFELKTQIKQGIEIESLQGNVRWALQGDLWIQEMITVDGRFKQSSPNQFETKLNIRADTTTIALEGQMNLTSIAQSSFNLGINTGSLPLVDSNGETSKLLDDMTQWFPTSAQIAYNTDTVARAGQTEGQITDESNIDLGIEVEIEAGESDLGGHLVLSDLGSAIHLGKLPSIRAQLKSNSLVYSNPSSETEVITEKPDKIFSNDPIEWQWTQGIDLNVVLDIAALKMDSLELTNLRLPLKMNQGVLSIKEMSTNLGAGVVDGSLNIEDKESSGLNVDLEMQASGFALQELELLDPKQLNGGTSNVEIAFSSTGQSAHDLAKNLNGKSLIHVQDANIGNDTFELIGSDLISELLVKLNPFVRSDPTTELKCAVVNLNVENGIVDIDKSVVVETSKMLLVADGKIDLDSEKINIEISPQATSGVGIDLSSLVKFMEIGGTLSKPAPKVGADGLLKTGVAVGAAVSTGGLSLLADGLMSKIAAGGACKAALAKGNDVSED